MKKQLLKFLTVCIGISAAQVPIQTLKAQTPTDENRIIVLENAGRLVDVSSNAKWAAGYILHDTGFLVNIETETVYKLGGDEVGWSEGWAVTDDGTIFGLANGLPAYWNNEGVFQGYLPVPGDPAEGAICGVTPDGKYVGGGVYGTAFRGVPLRWERQEDGTYQYRKLAVLEKDYFGKKILGGFYVDTMSEDGTLYAGRMSDNEYSYWPVIWKNVEEEEAPVIHGLEYLLTEDGHWNGWNGLPWGFSKDGKYVYGSIEDNTVLPSIKHPYKMEIATGAIELLQTRGPIIGVLLKNGDVVTADDNGTPYRNSYIDRASGKSYELAEFLKEFYGVDVQETILDQSGTIQDISSDERTWVGYGGIYGMAMGAIVYQLGNTSGDPELASVLKTQMVSPVVLSENGNIVIKEASGYKITVSDMAGKVCKTAIGEAQTVIPATKGQVYIVKVSMDKITYIKKVAVL